MNCGRSKRVEKARQVRQEAFPNPKFELVEGIDDEHVMKIESYIKIRQSLRKGVLFVVISQGSKSTHAAIPR
jgi:hypothetical protein